ncbi:hypothetical protein BU17DRAFT_46854 [Hysterangium stoloniferum]|nr:hypothetical protein BU17DRAFT_46854 [Hysterangium stoloniferum]
MLPQHFNPADYYSNSSQYVNGYSGASSQHPEPGSSTSTAHPSPQQHNSTTDDSHNKKQRGASKPKRKCGNSLVDDNADNSPGSGCGDFVSSAQKVVPKKKKANRACFHCQKAHLTCDDSRPCQRCIKRGLADKCTEGVRKKAKYLLDEDELGTNRKLARNHPQSTILPASVTPQLPPSRQELDPPPDPDPLFNLAFDPAYTFGSEAVNLEYSILTAILGNPSPPKPSRPSAAEASYIRPGISNQQDSLPYGVDTRPQDPIPDHSQSQGLPPLSPPPSNSSPGTPHLGENDFAFQLPAPGQSALMQQQQLQEQQQQRTAVSRASHIHQTPQWGFSNGSSISAPDNARNYTGGPAVVPSINGGSTQNDRPASNIYDSVVKPYNYMQGYHDLMQHLHERFDKIDILRVVRALAIVRPSLIALQMPLTEEDEVFVEKCFQRSLIELDKLISFGGTPTVVWRRTGEICLVGFEFTMLTGWSREELLGKGKYIYELFENQSTVEYFENFAAHAFENTTQSVISHCVLLKPSGAPVPCTFCFSIRRDIFDLPNIIIGERLFHPVTCF